MSMSSGHRTQPRAGTSRGTATAQRIERCAVALVIKHGFDATTVDMICAEAGVSQRTFFNHFATKDAAVIGTVEPRLDEQRVRAFIASDEPHILAEAIALVSDAAIARGDSAELMAQRIRAVSSSAVLMQRQLERFSVIEAELAEIIGYRLRRHARPDETDDELAEQSRLTAHLLAGVMRYIAGHLIEGGRPAGELVELTRQRLSALLPKLAAPASTENDPAPAPRE
jgi:AcrR family transcriptional regulator